MIVVAILLFVFQQQPQWFQVWPELRTVSALRTSSPVIIDGKLDEETWAQADWSEPFVDITGDPGLAPHLSTRTALAWNDTALFIAARLEEPHLWATLRQRDTIIYFDNDFEFFFDPDGDNHRYGEIEINANNTVWDLLLEKPYRDGGPARTDWNIAGIQHAVFLEGSLNDPSDIDRGWTIEVCIPWSGIAALSDVAIPPSEGTQWRINFSRVQWAVRDSGGLYQKVAGREDNWVWAPIGIVNMHVPERWGVLVFADRSPRRPEVQERERTRRLLMEAYHAQQAYRKEQKGWADTAEDLQRMLRGQLAGGIRIRRTSGGYEMRLPYADANGRRLVMGVTHDGRFFEEAEKD